MPRAKLTVSVPAETWIYDLSTAYPDAVFRVVTALGGEESGVALVELDYDDPVPVIAAIDARDDVTDLDLLWTHEDEALLQIETGNPLLLLPVWRVGVPLETPFEIQDGLATWVLATSSDRLSKLGDRLDEAGIAFDIEYVRAFGQRQVDQLLTKRQQELLLAGVDRGYYRTPRETTLTAIAEQEGISKATASDILHRAEGNIVHWFVDQYVASERRLPER
ncbi:helix-turn-helix domain-containing protein [Halobacteriaceae archaeon GCM10025711]